MSLHMHVWCMVRQYDLLYIFLSSISDGVHVNLTSLELLAQVTLKAHLSSSKQNRDIWSELLNNFDTDFDKFVSMLL